MLLRNFNVILTYKEEVRVDLFIKYNYTKPYSTTLRTISNHAFTSGSVWISCFKMYVFLKIVILKCAF